MRSGMSLTAELSAITYLSLSLAPPSRIGSFAFPEGATGSVIDGLFFPVRPGPRPLVSHLRPSCGVAHRKLHFPHSMGYPG